MPSTAPTIAASSASPPTGARPLRIAVLELDVPIPQLYAVYGGYGGMFKRLLEAGASDLESESGSPVPLEITAFNVVERGEYPDLETVDAVLMSGSKHDAFADTPWINTLVHWTQHTLLPNPRVALLGVCFGHQILARALGARVGRSAAGWEISAVDITLSAAGRRYFEGRNALGLYQLHKDIVFDVPKTLPPLPPAVPQKDAQILNLGSTALCEIHGLVLPGRFITVQGHPEFDARFMETVIRARHDIGAIDDKVYESGIERVAERHEGRLVAKVFVKFALEARDASLRSQTETAP